MALQFAIVEDQAPDAQRLEELLRQQLPAAECTWFACGDDFLQAAEPGQYAAVFLDICMAGTNGIETAQRLRQTDPEVLIVFVTSSPEYVWDAFPVHPFDYLLKPYRQDKFKHLVAELRRALRCPASFCCCTRCTALPGSSPAIPVWTGKTSCWLWNPAGT